MTTLRTVWEAIRNASGVAIVWWVLFAIGLLYEWGPFNEIAVTAGATSVFEPGWRSLLVGVVAGAMVTVTQLVLGWISVMAVTTSGPKVGETLARLPFETPPDDTSWGRRLWIAFVLGATAITLWAAATGERKRVSLGRLATTAALGAGAVTVVIGVTVGGIATAIDAGGRPELAQRVIDVVGSPLLWIGLFVLVETVGAVQRRRQT